MGQKRTLSRSEKGRERAVRLAREHEREHGSQLRERWQWPAGSMLLLMG
jgi:hypothetical protein